MPAQSKSQQRLMGMVHATQQGKLKNPPRKVQDMANSMSKEDAKHYAQTKHDKLPEKKSQHARHKRACQLLPAPKQSSKRLAEMRTKLAKYICKLALSQSPQGVKQASTHPLVKVARRFNGGQPLIPALRAEYPKLSKENLNKVAAAMVQRGLKATI